MATQITNYTSEPNYAAFPCVIKLANGDLLAAYYLANTHLTDTHGYTVIIGSSDNGTTWTQRSTVGEGTAYDLRGSDIFQDSAGTVWVIYTYRDGYNRIGFKKSNDNGVTWSDESLLPDLSSGTEVHQLRGKPCELRNGTIAFPTFWQSGSNQKSIVVLLDPATGEFESYDATSLSDGTYNEWMLVEKNDGTLIGITRGYSTNHYYRIVSSDGGQTWTAPVLTLTNNGNAHPAEIQLIDPGTLVAVYAKDRENGDLRMAVSYDDGVTWDFEIQVHDTDLGGMGFYASFCEISSGEFLVLFYYDTGVTGSAQIYQTTVQIHTQSFVRNAGAYQQIKRIWAKTDGTWHPGSLYGKKAGSWVKSGYKDGSI